MEPELSNLNANEDKKTPKCWKKLKQRDSKLWTVAFCNININFLQLPHKHTECQPRQSYRSHHRQWSLAEQVAAAAGEGEIERDGENVSVADGI